MPTAACANICQGIQPVLADESAHVRLQQHPRPSGAQRPRPGGEERHRPAHRPHTMVMTGPIIVLACGDELRGDDGVALVAVGALPPEALARAEVRILGAVAVEDLVALPAGSRVVIVDAVAGPAPGQLVESELAALTGRAPHLATLDAGTSDALRPAGMHPPAPDLPPASPMSSHQLPLPEVVALAGLLRNAPLEGRFVGVGIESVAFGSGLSTPVAAAVPALAEAIARAVRALG